MSMKRIDVTVGQNRLFILWLIGGGFTAMVLLLETMGPQAPLPAESSWQWFLPLVVPTASLMLGTFVFNALNKPDKRTVDRSIYTVCLALSAIYFVALDVLLLAWPLLRLKPEEVAGMLAKSQLWLPALQGLLGIALGAFFVAKGEK